MKKRFLVIAALIGLLVSCQPDNDNSGPKTVIVFDNTQGICAATVYDDFRRRDEDKIAEIPVGASSREIEWTPGASVPFYFKYHVSIKGIDGFLVDYVPDIGKDQISVRIDPNIKNNVKVPRLEDTVSFLDKRLSNNCYILFKNNSTLPFRLHRGSSPVNPDGSSGSAVVNPGESAQYTIPPGPASSYQLLVGAVYIPFPGSMDSFKAGYVYSFIFSGGELSLDSEVEMKFANVAGVLQEDTWANGSITSTESGSSFLYSFDVISGTTYYIWWNGGDYGDGTEIFGTKTFNIKVSAYYSNGTAIIFTTARFNFPKSFTAGTSGTVNIKVEPYSSGDTGTFAVAYSTRSTKPTIGIGTEADPISLLDSYRWVNGSITSTESGSAVWYSFNVTVGTPYNVYWDGGSRNGNKTLNIKVSAYYSNGTAIFTSVNQETSQSFTAGTNGTVKIKVEPYYSGDTGTFAVGYGNRGIPTWGDEYNPILLTAGNWVSGSPSQTSRWYSFNVTGGTRYYIWWRSNNSRGPNVSAYYGGGTSIFINGQSSPQTFTAGTSDTVIIKVDSYSITFDVAYSTSRTSP
ncbi:MAG: hypothetical protein LBQ89_05015 [Treponema sp.]|jgi:hypothetical protein|nr:hypothetical protein [Treponema sp.]